MPDKVINLREAAGALPGQGGHKGHVWRHLQGEERKVIGRGEKDDPMATLPALSISYEYEHYPENYGPRGVPQVGGVITTREAAEWLVLHSSRAEFLRVTQEGHWRQLVEMDAAGVEMPDMDELMIRIARQLEIFNIPTLEQVARRCRATLVDMRDVSESEAGDFVYHFLKFNGVTWLDLVFDEYAKPLPEDDDSIIDLALALWITSEAAAAIPRWGLSDERMDREIRRWLASTAEENALSELLAAQP